MRAESATATYIPRFTMPTTVVRWRHRRYAYFLPPPASRRRQRYHATAKGEYIAYDDAHGYLYFSRLMPFEGGGRRL